MQQKRLPANNWQASSGDIGPSRRRERIEIRMERFFKESLEKEEAQLHARTKTVLICVNATYSDPQLKAMTKWLGISERHKFADLKNVQDDRCTKLILVKLDRTKWGSDRTAPDLINCLLCTKFTN